MEKIKIILGVSILLLVSSSVFALPMLQVDSEGFLTGAKKVTVGNKLYNVTFEAGYDPNASPDGRCALIFDGCDSSDDFFFSEPEDALAAADALLNQVFIDSKLGNFDSNPLKVYGCGDELKEDWACYTLTPFEYSLSPSFPDDYIVRMSIVSNTLDIANIRGRDNVNPFNWGTGYTDFFPDYVEYDKSLNNQLIAYNWAVWSIFDGKVPEPPAILLFGIGLIGLIGFTKRRKACR